MTVRTMLVAPLLALLIGFAAVGVASAHADLVSSTPADGAVLDAAPARIVLVFSEELSADGNLVTVTDASGARADAGDTALDTGDAERKTLTVSLNAGLGDGAYTVSWKNASTDGHSEEGTLSFTVGAPAAATTTAAPAAMPATGAGDGPAAAALLACAAVLVAAGLGLRRRAAGL
jgi:methionine-rich copper-binding protein CopC